VTGHGPEPSARNPTNASFPAKVQSNAGQTWRLGVVIERFSPVYHATAFHARLRQNLPSYETCKQNWSRELQALGHTVRLIPPAYVKPYVKRQKNDAADAEAICEAVQRPSMRFVPTKTPEQ
jgi:transposase